MHCSDFVAGAAYLQWDPRVLEPLALDGSLVVTALAIQGAVQRRRSATPSISYWVHPVQTHTA